MWTKTSLPLRPHLLRKAAVDRAGFDRERRAVRMGVMDHVVKGAAGDLGEREPRQRLRRLVHEHAVLLLIHQEHRHRRIVENGVKSGGDLPQLGLDLPVARDVLDGRVEYPVAALIEHLQLDRNVVVRPVLAPVDRFKVQPLNRAREQRMDHGQKRVARYVRLQIPRRQALKLIHRVAEVLTRALVDQPKAEILTGEDVDFTGRFLDDAPETLAGQTDAAAHARNPASKSLTPDPRIWSRRSRDSHIDARATATNRRANGSRPPPPPACRVDDRSRNRRGSAPPFLPAEEETQP